MAAVHSGGTAGRRRDVVDLWRDDYGAVERGRPTSTTVARLSQTPAPGRGREGSRRSAFRSSRALPYAVALGLASAWAKFLKTQPHLAPTWFRALPTSTNDSAAFVAFVAYGGAGASSGAQRRRGRGRSRRGGGRSVGGGIGQATLSRATCYVLCATCEYRATCACHVRRATCDVRRATCDVRRATCSRTVVRNPGTEDRKSYSPGRSTVNG